MSIYMKTPARRYDRLAWTAGVILLLIASFFFFRTPDYTDMVRSQWTGKKSSNSPSYDMEVLERLNITSKTFEYRRHCVVAKPSRGVVRQSALNASWPLLTEPSYIETAGSNDKGDVNRTLFPSCGSTVSLPVPRSASISAAGSETIMLGVATSLHRLDDSLPQMARWLSNTNARLLVLLRDTPNDTALHSTLDTIVAFNVNVTILPPSYSEQSESKSNFGLGKAMYDNRGPKTKWFGIIDDDTFFVSLARLHNALSAFDPTKNWYLGSLSERHIGIATEGLKAWGGAGIFISLPLLAQVASHTPECLALKTGWGDAMWRACVRRITSPTVQLTQLPGLNQLDMFGDMSGWYESGPDPLLTIHHWKSWHKFPVPTAHLVSDVAGADAFLQRYTSHAEEVVFTNGFSIARYPKGLPNLDLVEGTMYPYPGSSMPGDGWQFHDSLGELRPALKAGIEKISWRFVHAEGDAQGCVRQFYVKRAEIPDPTRPGGRSDIDSVIEVDWCL